MRQSQLFTKTLKEAPKDESSDNAQLLIRGGYIHKHMAGTYEFLPLGVQVTENLSQIVREEMNAIGGQELKMTVLQNPVSWKESGRWGENVSDAWFKTRLQDDTELGLGWTHEEPLTSLLANYINSYRDLPVYPYQIQVKLRNELRAKSGIMRGREFLMKDLYSFSRSKKEHDAFYEKAKRAYHKIFERIGLGDKTYYTIASGSSFAKFSHEFQTLTDVGEDTIYLDREKQLAINQEVYTDEVVEEFGLSKESLVEVSAAEVGNIFPLGTKFSDTIDLSFETENNERKPVIMGSYGIGITRLMGVIAEIFSDEKGLTWPDAVAPYTVHLVSIGNSSNISNEADNLYTRLHEKGITILYDDREARPGEKLADADLLGMPYRIVVSEKSLEEGGYELKRRDEDEVSIVGDEELLNMLL